MARKRIVYHGTWSTQPPHEFDKPFHVGTEKSARDRLESGEGIPDGMGWMQTIHAYEIDESHVDPKIYSDPHFGDTYHNIWKEKHSFYGNVVPENSTRIVKYLNDHEDRGSVSYVIPPGEVQSGRVRHLGVQFRDIDHNDPRSIR